MAADTEIAVAIAIEIVLMGCVMNTVTGDTVHRLSVARIQSVLAHRVGNRVLMGVTFAAEVYGILPQQQWQVTSVSAVTGLAGQV